MLLYSIVLEIDLKLRAMEQASHLIIIRNQSTLCILFAKTNLQIRHKIEQLDRFLILKECLHVKYLAKTLYFCFVINEVNSISVVIYVSLLTL